MTTTRRIFSLDEVNALLPELEVRISKFLQKKEMYARRHDEVLMHELINRAEQNDSLLPDTLDLDQDVRELESAITYLEKDVREILALGGVLRNVEKGWVDFLGEWQGQKIYFCWKMGEKTVQYYHDLEDSNDERKCLIP